MRDMTGLSLKLSNLDVFLYKPADISRAEAGCLNSDVQQYNDNQAHFLPHRNRKSRELWQVNMGDQHLHDHIVATESAVQELQTRSLLSHLIPSPLQGEKARMRGKQRSCLIA